MIAGNAKSASDAMHSTVVRELGLRPWEYGWNRDTYVVGLLTRAAGGGNSGALRCTLYAAALVFDLLMWFLNSSIICMTKRVDANHRSASSGV
jgi:hypothetical protein